MRCGLAGLGERSLGCVRLVMASEVSCQVGLVSRGLSEYCWSRDSIFCRAGGAAAKVVAECRERDCTEV